MEFWFVSGPRDGEKHRARGDLFQVEVELDYEDWQDDGSVKTKKGYYSRMGNLLVWNGWIE